MRTVLLTSALCWLLSSPAVARDIYVDNVAGDDHFQGGQPGSTGGGGGDGPLRTIGAALKLARGLDRIIVANTGEPYRESICLVGGYHSGDATRPFVIEGNGATLDGTIAIDPGHWVLAGGEVFRYQPRRMAYQLLYLDGVPATRRTLAPGESPVDVLQPLEWCLHRGAIYFRIEPGAWIDGYQLSHTGLTVGLGLYHARHAVVYDLVVQGFQLDGVNVHDSHDCVLSGLTSRGNARSGLTIAGSSRATAANCLIGDNGTVQVLIEGYCQARLVGCEILANKAPDVVRRGGEVEIEE